MRSDRQEAPSIGVVGGRLYAMALGLASLLSTAMLGGCIGAPQNPAATQPVTVSDPATTQPSYWYDQPAVATVNADHFDLLVGATETILRDYCFLIDRVDYRQGLITTEPLVGAQFFEPWRRDNQTADDVTKSSLGTRRRTVRVEIVRNDDGTFTATPKILIEGQSVAEQRITNVVAYRGNRRPTDPKDTPRGTKESDQGIVIPSKYWYPIGRDEALERKLATEIQARLPQEGR